MHLSHCSALTPTSIRIVAVILVSENNPDLIFIRRALRVHANHDAILAQHCLQVLTTLTVYDSLLMSAVSTLTVLYEGIDSSRHA